MKILMIVLIAASALACATAPEMAEIVLVHCEHKGGSEDCSTIVEVSDGSRHRRVGAWGEVGDSLLVRLYIGDDTWGSG